MRCFSVPLGTEFRKQLSFFVAGTATGEAEGLNGFPPVDGITVNELRAVIAGKRCFPWNSTILKGLETRVVFRASRVQVWALFTRP
jgi:hypothetical protein